MSPKKPTSNNYKKKNKESAQLTIFDRIESAKKESSNLNLFRKSSKKVRSVTRKVNQIPMTGIYKNPYIRSYFKKNNTYFSKYELNSKSLLNLMLKTKEAHFFIKSLKSTIEKKKNIDPSLKEKIITNLDFLNKLKLDVDSKLNSLYAGDVNSIKKTIAELESQKVYSSQDAREKREAIDYHKNILKKFLDNPKKSREVEFKQLKSKLVDLFCLEDYLRSLCKKYKI